MQSETGNPSTTPSSSIPPVSNPSPEITTRTGLQHGESPLDFIRKNLRSAAPVEVAPPAPEPPAEVAATSGTEEEPTYDLNPKGDTPEKKVAPEAPTEEVVDSKEENFKILRKKVGETSALLKAKETEAQKLAERLKKFETGEELPDIVKKKDEEINRLSRFEKLVSLKTSPAYKEAFVKPLEGVKARLSEIAKDYEIPPEVLSQAETITNVKDLNQFLLQHFDEVGALEVKGLVGKIQEIQSAAEDAEEEPQEALQDLESNYQKIEADRKAQAHSRIVAQSKDAWVDSLLKIRQEGKIPELIHKDNDPEYNQKVVQPILQQASSEYGRLVKMLVDNGLERMPKDVSFALARLVHLAHASAVSIETRNSAQRELAAVKEASARTTKYTRPPLGGSMGGAGGGEDVVPSQPTSPQAAARAILNKVMKK